MWCNGRPKIWHNCCRGEEKVRSHFPQKNCLLLWASAVNSRYHFLHTWLYGHASWQTGPTPTRIIIVVIFRLFCFFYIRIEIVLLGRQAPRRHVSVPVVWSILSVRFFLLSFSQKCPWYFSLKWHHVPTASSYLRSCCADWVYWIWHDALKWWQSSRDNNRNCQSWRGNSTGPSSLSSSATHVGPELDDCPAVGKYGIERTSISVRRLGVF